VLELTFQGVGLTPNNKYHVYVAEESGLIEQWDVFGNRSDPEPRFSMPWRDWKPYGPILLSGDRGARKITEIAVLEAMPPGAMDEPRTGRSRPAP
jgi:hypothetical protein